MKMKEYMQTLSLELERINEIEVNKRHCLHTNAQKPLKIKASPIGILLIFVELNQCRNCGEIISLKFKLLYDRRVHSTKYSATNS